MLTICLGVLMHLYRVVFGFTWFPMWFSYFLLVVLYPAFLIYRN
jgi:hypothetical protein